VAVYYKSEEMKGVFVAGFPYVRENYFATWRYVPDPAAYRFLLPRRWTAKGGKVVFMPPDDTRIIPATAYFHDSHAPLIGGLLKGWMPAFPLVLWRQRHDIQLVYSCSEPILLTTAYQALWSKLMGKRHVCFTWENISYDKKFRGISKIVHSLILRLNLALSDGLICGNPEGETIHRRLTNKPISVIPMNGLDPEQFRRVDTSLHPTHLAGRVVYTFVGAIGYRKGLHRIIEAFSRVVQEVPNAHLIIAGSGEYEHELERLLERSLFKDRVTRFPWVNHHELIRLLSASDIFLYPSISYGGWAEQFGYAMAEASLMELPVIATRSGSISHVIRDGQTGILVGPDTVGELSDAMIRLGTDAELRLRLGRAGRAWIIERYAHQHVARQFSDFFNSLMKQNSPHA
jgi:glycosyltransferase involved in cell wall biosynthesis